MQPTALTVIAGGVFLALMLMLQVASGKRWIRFGHRQMRVHSRTAWVIVALTALHGLGALAYLGYIPTP